MAEGIIYKAFNKVNNKIYIGQTIRTLHQRRNQHYADSFNDNKKDYHFNRALKKYKKEDWIWEVIESCEYVLLPTREIYWIDFYKSFKEGYNSTLGGEGVLGLGKIHKIYHPEYGVLEGDYKYISDKIGVDLYGVNNLSCGRAKSMKGWVLYKHKDNYNQFMKLGRKSDIIKIYHIKYGSLEGKIKILHKLINCHYSSLYSLYKNPKRYKFLKGWVLYNNKDKYKEILNYKKVLYNGKVYEGQVKELCDKLNISNSTVYNNLLTEDIVEGVIKFK